mmetsp:Transcript_51127/g.91947  ORF Transcript_51127/g.91947 Transcript_51127/m.91947 type:complete len:155 (-) Transcript_51127:72-536(-)
MAAFHGVVLIAALVIHPCRGQTEVLPTWKFRVTLDDTLHLPAGTRGSDLLADAAFLEFVQRLLSGAMVLPIAHIPPSAFQLQNATLLEDIHAEALNAHGGVGNGKKVVRFVAELTIDSRPIAMEIWRLPALSLAGIAPWRKLRIETITDMSIFQ